MKKFVGLLALMALFTSCGQEDTYAENAEAPTHYEKLQGLEWLVGEWVDEGEDARVVSNFSWDKYKNFLTQRFKVYEDGKIQMEGTQIIGWDPVNEKVISWVFDSDGGFGTGEWRKDGDRLIVDKSNTLPDGSIGTSTNILTPVDQNSYKWKSIGRDVDGEILPNIDEVTIIRSKGRS